MRSNLVALVIGMLDALHIIGIVDTSIWSEHALAECAKRRVMKRTVVTIYHGTPVRPRYCKLMGEETTH